MRQDVKEFLAGLEVRGLQPETLRGYRQSLGLFRTCGYMLDRFRSRLSPGVVLARRQLVHVLSYLRFTGKRTDVAVPQPPRRPPLGAPSREEVGRFLASLSGTTPIALRNRAMAELLYSSGIRACEAVRLGIPDVDLAGRLLRVRGKGARIRSAPFGPSAANWLREYVERARPRFRPHGDEIFVSKFGGRMTAPDVERVVLVARRRAGISRAMTAHGLRRAAAKHCMEAGMHIREVQELLGHARLETTVRYTAVGLPELRCVIDRCHPRRKM